MAGNAGADVGVLGWALGCVAPVRTRRVPSPVECVCRFTAWRSGEKANMAATVVKGGEAGSPSRAGERRAILFRSRRAVSTKKAPRRVPGGAVRDRSAALLGTSSQARDPATDNNNSAEGSAKEEDALT